MCWHTTTHAYIEKGTVGVRQYVKVADPQFLPDAVGALYANPVSTTAFVKSVLVFNSGVSTETVKLYNVPDNTGAVGTASAVNQFLEVDIVAKETFMLDLPYPITLTDENDTIQGETTTASTVSIHLLGDIAL